MVERLTVNQDVVGSIPTIPAYWGVAQVVEHLIWDQEVAGSSPATPISLPEQRTAFRAGAWSEIQKARKGE